MSCLIDVKQKTDNSQTDCYCVKTVICIRQDTYTDRAMSCLIDVINKKQNKVTRSVYVTHRQTMTMKKFP